MTSINSPERRPADEALRLLAGANEYRGTQRGQSVVPVGTGYALLAIGQELAAMRAELSQVADVRKDLADIATAVRELTEAVTTSTESLSSAVGDLQTEVSEVGGELSSIADSVATIADQSTKTWRDRWRDWLPWRRRITAYAAFPETGAARPGDLIIVRQQLHVRIEGQFPDSYSVGEVIKVDEHGQPTTWRSAGLFIDTAVPDDAETIVIPQHEVDVAAAVRKAAANLFPGRSGVPRPYRSMDELRSALDPHLRTPTAVVALQTWGDAS